jgi:hypothetical protein
MSESNPFSDAKPVGRGLGRGNSIPEIVEKQIIDMYVNKHMGSSVIANKFDMSPTTVFRVLDRHNQKSRNNSDSNTYLWSIPVSYIEKKCCDYIRSAIEYYSRPIASHIPRIILICRLGGKCTVCGLSIYDNIANIHFLAVDHLCDNGATDRDSEGSINYSDINKRMYNGDILILNQYQVMCHTHNQIKEIKLRRRLTYDRYLSEYRLKDKINCFKHYSSMQIPSCICCKYSDDIDGLTLDAIDSSTHQHYPWGGKDLYQKLRSLNYPPGFQVMCMSCNKAKHTRSECPHKSMKHAE